MKRLTRISATVASSAFIISGIAGVAGASPAVTGNGNNSSNHISQSSHVRTHVSNDASVSATNNNPQSANTGSARLHDNYTGGDVGSGMASNASSTAAAVDVDYTAATAAALAVGAGASASEAPAASIADNGNDSWNKISQKSDVSTTVHNDSSVTLTNNNSQSANTGSASASDNYHAGSVTSGDASNTSTTSFSVSVKY